MTCSGSALGDECAFWRTLRLGKPGPVAEDGAARAAPKEGSLRGDEVHCELPQAGIDPHILADRLDRAGARIAPGRRAAGQSAAHQVLLD